jgi:guanylate kinase
VRPGIPFVVAAPSGTGKTTVCQAVVERDSGIELSISHTTRPRRVAEVDGRDYHFVDTVEFRRMEGEGAFLESATYNDNLYGTSWAAIEAPLAAGRDVLLEIEVQGAEQVSVRRDDAPLIFLLPPSMPELQRRLERRGTEAPAQIQKRLAVAERELEAILSFDYAVTNAALERCILDVMAIIAAERAGEGVAMRSRFSPARAREHLLSAD